MIKRAGLVFVLLIFVVSSFLALTGNKTEAASADSSFYYFTGGLNNSQGICSVETDKACNGRTSVDVEYFYKQGNPTPTTTLYTFTSGQTQYITVNNCDPTKGTFRKGSGSESKISIRGSSSGQELVCSQTPPSGSESTSTKKINVTITYYTDLPDDRMVGPVTVERKNEAGSTVLQTIELPAVENNSNYVTLTGTFEGVEPGKYQICVPSIKESKESCKTREKVPGNILLIDFIGEAKDIAFTDPTSQEESTCESEGGPLAWILCSVIHGLDAGVNILDERITALLVVPENNLSEPGFQAAVNKIRNIAYIVLVPIMLIMVFGTALGIQAIDAYTVKRALPRLIVAVIFITLTLPITSFLVEFTNTLGRGIAGLVLGTVAGDGDVSLASIVSVPQGTTVTGATLVSGFVIFKIFSAEIIPIVLLLALGAFLILLIAFFVLAIRQVLILVLALLAPVAILAWIFPGNDRLWRLWWGSFSKLLLMFPLIALLIASGKAFASFVPVANEKGILGLFVVVAAYIGPYLFIPATFKFAGGVFASISGAVNDRSRGLFDRMKGARQNLVKRGFQQSREGSRGNFAAKLTRPDAFLPGRLSAKGQSALSTAASASTNQYAKVLQEAGLLDDAAGNEFIQHGGSIGSLRKRQADLRKAGKHELADQLGAYAQFAGNRGARLGAAKLNASFGKLSDGSLQSVGEMFGSSSVEQAALSHAFGDLVFTSKNAGNYVTYSAYRDSSGTIRTLSDTGLDSDGKDIRTEMETRLSKNLMAAGPQALSSIKPYEDKTAEPRGGVGYSVKQVTADAVARAAVNAPGADGSRQFAPVEQGSAMESFVMAEMSGAYNDAETKAAFTRATDAIMADPQALALYEETRNRIAQRASSPGERENILGGPPQPPTPPIPG